ncbi:MAG TPA: ACP S-malonyltransferase [Allosphingosinicella sp.]|nr:ACP S-malonyltransferase [Allosphingosinicella sp.]
MAEAALVVCPGRGTYGKAELGYLKRHHGDKAELIGAFDRLRSERGQPTLSELDAAERFSPALHTRGDIASPLIFAASYADFLAIDRSRFEIAAVTGNSMGWYTALAVAGAVGAEQAFRIVDEGEQVLALADSIGTRDGCRLHVSIELGGMIVFAGNEAGLAALLAEAPPTPAREPLRLVNHGPFHTPLMAGSSERALAQLPVEWFGSPEAPMIDGRGHFWRPFATNAAALRDYTFVAQILETYDFTRAIQVAVREQAPDRIILLGPGDTLGGAIAQALIAIQWRGLRSKRDFQEMQAGDPFLLALGREEQRALVAG